MTDEQCGRRTDTVLNALGWVSLNERESPTETGDMVRIESWLRTRLDSSKSRRQANGSEYRACANEVRYVLAFSETYVAWLDGSGMEILASWHMLVIVVVCVQAVRETAQRGRGSVVAWETRQGVGL